MARTEPKGHPGPECIVQTPSLVVTKSTVDNNPRNLGVVAKVDILKNAVVLHHRGVDSGLGALNVSASSVEHDSHVSSVPNTGVLIDGKRLPKRFPMVIGYGGLQMVDSSDKKHPANIRFGQLDCTEDPGKEWTGIRIGVASRDAKKGEELFVHTGKTHDERHLPPVS